MGKGFNSVDYTYGVGLEFHSDSAKGVKDELKSQLDAMQKLVKGYNKILKIDPSADLGNLTASLNKLKGLLDAVGSSGNPLDGLVDKGLLTRISDMESQITTLSRDFGVIKKDAAELKNLFVDMVAPLKEIAGSKFPATFKNLFGGLTDQSETIKQQVDNIKNLQKYIKELVSAQKKLENIDENQLGLSGKHTKKEVLEWVSQFKALSTELEKTGKSLDASSLFKKLNDLTELSMKIKEAQVTFQNDLNGSFGASIDKGFNEAKFNRQINSGMSMLKNMLQQLDKAKSEAESLQAKYVESLDVKAKAGKSLGLQNDYTAQVKILPKANEAEWKNILNKTIENISNDLVPLVLKPTFLKNSKNVSKEIDSEMAKVIHKVDVELKLTDNLQQFNQQIQNIDLSIKHAKALLEKEGNFKIKFEYEEEGRFKDVAYDTLNKFKNIETVFKVKGGAQYIKDVKELRQKTLDAIGKIPISFYVEPDKKFRAQIDKVTEQVQKEIKPIGVRLEISNIQEFSDNIKKLQGFDNNVLNNSSSFVMPTGKPMELPPMMKQFADQFGQMAQKMFQGNLIPSQNVETSVREVVKPIDQLTEKAQKAQKQIEKLKKQIESLQMLGPRSPEFLKLGSFNAELKREKGSIETVKDLIRKHDELGAKLKATNEEKVKFYGTGPEAKAAYQKDVAQYNQINKQVKLIWQGQLAYTHKRLAAQEEILQKEKETNQVAKDTEKTKTIKKPKTAEDKAAIAHQRKLNKELKETRNILKDLESNGIHSKYLQAIGTWDPKNKVFNKDTKNIQDMISQYQKLTAARNASNKAEVSHEEYVLRNKLVAILVAQKKHIKEIIAAKQKEKDAYRETAVEATQEESKQEVKTKDKVKDLQTLTKQLAEAKKALASLKKDQINAITGTGLGDIGGRLKGKEASLDILLKNYQRILAAKKEMEESGKQNSNDYKSTLKVLADTENKLKTIYQDQVTYCNRRIKALSTEVTARKKLETSEQKSAKAAEKKTEAIEHAAKSTESTKAGSTPGLVRIDANSLSALAKDQSLKNIDSKLSSILTKLNGISNKKGSSDKTNQSSKDSKNSAHEGIRTSRKSLFKLPKLQSPVEIQKQLEAYANKVFGKEYKGIKTKAIFDAKTNELTGAQFSYKTLDGLNTITQNYGLVMKDASSKVREFSLKTTTVTENTEAYNRTLQRDIEKQHRYAHGYQKQSAMLRGALNPGANKTLANTAYAPELATRISDIEIAINKLMATGSNGKSVLYSPAELNKQIDALDTMVREAKEFVQVSRSKQYAPIAFDAKNVESSVGRYKAQLAAFTEQVKRAGLYSGKMKDDIDALAEKLNTVQVGKDLREYQSMLATTKAGYTETRSYSGLYKDLEISVGKMTKLQAQMNDSKTGQNTKAALVSQIKAEQEIYNSIMEQLNANKSLYDINKINLTVEQARAKANREIALASAKQADRDIESKSKKFNNIVEKAQQSFDKMGMIGANSPVELSDAMYDKYTQYSNLLDQLKAKQMEIANNPLLLNDPSLGTFVTNTTEQMRQLETSFTSLSDSSLKFLSNLESTSDLQIMGQNFDPNNIDAMKVAMDEFANSMGYGQAQLMSFDPIAKTATYQVQDNAGALRTITVEYDKATNALGRYTSKLQEQETGSSKFFNSIKNGFKNVTRYLATFGSVYRVFAMIKQGFSYVVDIDSALVELKKVTDETDLSYSRFLQHMSETASVVGSTVTELTNMSAEWARLGYSMEEAGLLAKNTAILLNVSEFNSAEEASKALISVMQAYEFDAMESQHVVDILNEVGNNFAISSDGVATALKHSASALMEAGNDLEQSVALVAAANKVVQDPHSVGAALRTISLRIRGTSVKVLEDMGEEIDGVAKSASKLQVKVKALSGVDLLDADGNYKDTYTILKEIGDVWKDMNDIDQAALLELLAGKNRANTLAAILSNMEDLKGAYASAMDAEGSALKENEKYLDSIQGRMDIFKTSVQTLWMNLINSDALKFFVDLGSAIVKTADAIGVIPTALGSFVAFKTISSGVQEGLKQINKELAKSAVATANKTAATEASAVANAEEAVTETEATVATQANVAAGAQDVIMTKARTAATKGLIVAKAVLKGLGIGLLVAAGTALITKGISMIGDLIDRKVINRVKYLKEEVEDLTNTFRDTNQKLSTEIKSLTDSADTETYKTMQEEFDHLTQGVDSLGNNVSLTSDEYERYVEICNTIVGVNPRLKDGYDSVTAAIGNNAGALAELIELEKIRARENAAEFTEDDNLSKILEDRVNDIKTYQQDLQYLLNANGVNGIVGLSEILYKAYNWNDQGTSDYGDKTSNSDDLAKYILQQLKYTDKEITSILSNYYNEHGYFQYQEFIKGSIGNDLIADIIANNAHMLDSSMVADWATKWESTKRQLDDMSNGMIETLLQVPNAMKEYDTLSDPTKSFITNWIKNSGNFSIDENTTSEMILEQKAKIRDFVIKVSDLSGYAVGFKNSDVKYTAEDLLDQIFDLQKADVDWNKYKAEMSKLINWLWFSIGKEKNTLGFKDKGNLALSLGVDFDFDADSDEMKAKNEAKMIERYAQVAKISEEEAKKYFDSLPAAKVHRYLKIDWDTVDEKNYKEKMYGNVKFNIVDYAESIETLYGNVEKYKQALESLESGEFGMTDFVALIKEFPELAEGVDTSSKTFNGLYKNLKKAIKSSPDPLIEDLKELSAQLKEMDKSSDEVDRLIESIENMPTDAVENLEESYAGLAEQIRSARVAQNQLEQDMQDQKTGYETRSEALTKMEEFLKRGEIGSDSQMWDIADTYGFEFDFAKSVEENADALEHFIEVEKKYFKLNEEGQADFQGTKDFITDVEEALKSQGGLEGVTWEYNNGNPLIDFANKDFDKIVEALRKTDQFADLTADSFTEMLSQIARWFDFDWGDHNDKMDSFLAQQKQKYSEYYNGLTNGNFDYTKAQYKTAEEMAEKGWDIGEGNFATTFDSSVGIFDAEKQEHQVVLSVIGPDGEILSEKELSDYISNTLEGANNILEADKIENGGKGLIINDVIGSADDFDAEAFNEKIQKYKDMALQMHELAEYGALKSGEVAKLYSNDIASFFNVQGEELDAVIKDFKQRYKDAVEIINDPTGIIQAFDLSEGVINTDTLKYLQNLSDVITISDSSNTIFANFDELTKMGQEAGYTDEQMNQLLDTIKKVNKNIVNLETSKEDPLGLNSLKGNASVLSDYLNALNVSNVLTPAQGSLQASVSIDIPSLAETMVNAGYTDEAIRSYMNSLPMDANTKLTIDGAEVNQEEIDAQLDTILVNVREQNSEIPVEVKVDSTQAQGALNTIIGLIDRVHGKTVYIYAREKYIPDPKNPANQGTNNGRTTRSPGKPIEYGPIPAPRFMGNAFNRGNIGAKKSEDALVGELGQEMVVRGNQWFTVGDRGAEFTGIKRGDIIFNHKQTEDLLRNGASKTRGKAFISGTAYVHSHGTWSDKWDDRRNSGGNNQSTSTSRVEKAAEEFLEIFDWIEVRLEEINEQLDLHSAMVENAVGFGDKNAVIDEMLKISDSLHSNLIAGAQEYNRYANELLGKIPEAYREAAKNGKISIEEFRGEADEKTIGYIKDYREWTQKVADLTQQLEELKTEIAELAKQKFDNIVDEFDHLVNIVTKANDKLNAQIDLMENKGYVASSKYYEAMIENSLKHKEHLQEEKRLLQETLDEEVRNGNIQVGSDKWYEMIEQLYEVDNAIIDCTNDLEDYQNAINDIYWDNFDELVNRLEYLEDETDNIIGLMEQEKAISKPDNDKGWTEDQVKWTEEGMASLGLYAQQMEMAEYKSKQYGKAIEDLNKDYKAGKYSETEYLEKLNELKKGQYDSIQAYHDAKEAIKDLNQERIDAIKEGIEKEIDAYGELIEKKKEELDAEKDLYDFQKNVADQQKNIADIERKLSALSVDNSASAIAQKKRLEAQLAEEKQKLEDSYYDRSVENRQEALDKELEDFETEKNSEMEKWDKYMEDLDKVISDSMTIVQTHADEIFNTLNQKSNEFGIQMSDSITMPWKDGALAVSGFKDEFGQAMSSTIEQLNKVANAWQSIIEKMEQYAQIEIDKQKNENNQYGHEHSRVPPKPFEPNVNDTPTNNGGSSGGSGDSGSASSHAGLISGMSGMLYPGLRGENVRILQQTLNDMGFNAGSVDGIYGYNTKMAVFRFQQSGDYGGYIPTDGIVGDQTKNKFRIAGYSLGSSNIKKNQLAMVDENGLEEIIMHAGKDGRLEYLSKGSAVIPHDISENLMQLGKLDPSSVLEKNKPTIGLHPEIHNTEINIDSSIAELIHIDNCSTEALPDVEKIVNKAIEKHTQNLNNLLKRTRR